MKKPILILIFSCLLLFSACSPPQPSDEDVNVNPFFNAEIVRWDTDEILLSPVDIPDEDLDDQFVLLHELAIPASTFEEYGITAWERGDMVRIVCSGLSEDDSGAVSLDTVFSIYLLDADGHIVEK